MSTSAVFDQNPTQGHLTPEQVDQFHRDGYLALPGFFDPAPVLKHAKSLIGAFDPRGHPLTKFSTGGEDGQDSAKHVGDNYFLESGDDIRYFLEEGALDTQGNLLRPPHLAVNKCGHALHALDPFFKQFSFSPALMNVARSLGVHKDPRVLQSMIICKQPSIGGPVPSHNDSTFLFTDPPSAIGFWFALEDCTFHNGTLSFLPGSHRWPVSGHVTAPTPGPQAGEEVPRPRDDPSTLSRLGLGVARGVNKRFVRSHPGDTSAGTGFETLSTSEEVSWDSSSARLEEVPAGTLVLIHGSVLHKSEKNTSSNCAYFFLLSSSYIAQPLQACLYSY